MTNIVRHHLGTLAKDAGYVPTHLTKQAFGNRLFKAMQERGWNQSELARRAGLPRDSISTYIRGKSLPTRQSLEKLADVLDVAPELLLPNVVERAIAQDVPSIEIKVSTANPGLAWLRVDRMVTLRTALDVAAALNADEMAPKADAGE